LDYIHYNPVKHGYVTKPEAWHSSSYLEWIKRGEYVIGWGHKEIEGLKKLNFE
jgi:putative transposase